VAALDREAIAAVFADLVNLSADEIEQWLDTPESRRVGWNPDGGESIGHAAGRRIADILRRPEGDLDDEDYLHMRKTIGFIRRHRAQQPANIVTSRWRWSLMNWGHDPLR
jgi:hypothetical protein